MHASVFCVILVLQVWTRFDIFCPILPNHNALVQTLLALHSTDCNDAMPDRVSCSFSIANKYDVHFSK